MSPIFPLSVHQWLCRTLSVQKQLYLLNIHLDNVKIEDTGVVIGPVKKMGYSIGYFCTKISCSREFPGQEGFSGELNVCLQ